MASIRKIASNLLWTPEGVVRDPLLTVAEDGCVVAVERCSEPDRVPFTEFHAGMLVQDFPADWRETFRRMQTVARPLDELLHEVVPAPEGVLVVLSGLDYETMRVTPKSQIRKIELR